ncbi:MAG: circadian clock protein KaiC [Tangfeifania sp.]
MNERISNLQIKKVKTGIDGLDEITFGGLPFARPTLVSGYAGSGKTVLAIQFILNGIQYYNEPGVFISLEETEDDLRKNMASFGYDLDEMEKSGKLAIDNIRLDQTQLHKSGRFDLTPLFLRIEEAIKKVGAERIAIDTFEQIFSQIKDRDIFRQELVRLIHWLKEKKLTTVFTSEKPAVTNPKSGINEFITDCVINLSHSHIENVYTRRLHILKYRGSMHGTNEYPFLISSKGISLLPITAVEIHHVSNDVLPTGVKGLDEKIDKNGFYVGSNTLISGTSGVGKTSMAMSVCLAAMKQNKKALFFTFEESKSQLMRNMKSLGLELEEFEKKGLLKIVTSRPTALGIEAHLVTLYENIENFKPDVLALDPITDLMEVGTKKEVRGMIIRIIDYLKNNLITVVFTALIRSGSESPSIQMSSMVDNWIKLDILKKEKENQPYITIVKTRGMEHARNSFLLKFTGKGLKTGESI